MKRIAGLNKNNFYKIIFLVCFWVFVALFMAFYDWAAIVFDPTSIKYMDEHYDYQFTNTLISGLTVTIIGGIFIAAIEVLYFSKLLRKVPLGISLLARAAFYLINIFFFTSLGYFLESSLKLGQPLFHRDIVLTYITYLISPRLITIWIFWGMAVMLALFILQISEKLGQGVLINFLLGKYHRPRQVDRIFMFLDLKSSTTYAEKLGHVKYSELIQDCFYDLTDVVATYNAQIYQYVGDEAVLLWNIEPGLKNLNCINSFFAYDHAIIEKKEYYEKKYSLVPEFKAGLDYGRVTVAEVGEIKKELAYHGDVLNTASRITGKCNELQAKMLISERLKNRLSDRVSSHRFELIGEVSLKGKEMPINIFKVKPS